MAESVKLSEVNDEISKFGTMNIAETISVYEERAHKYDEDYDKCGYNGPKHVAEMAREVLGDNKSARIIDIAAGTGRVAQILFEWGYTNIDGIDGSQRMKELAVEKKLYKNFYVDLVIATKTKDIPDNTYDCLVTCGSFVQGHLEDDVIPEFMRMMKPGGYLCIAMKEYWMFSHYKASLECNLFALMEERKLKRLSRRLLEKYWGTENGIGFIYQVNK